MNLSILLLLLISSSLAARVRDWSDLHSASNHEHHCIHDQLEAARAKQGLKPITIRTSSPVHRITKAEAQKKRALTASTELQYPTFKPIRIKVDTSSLYNDSYTCYSAGQVIQVFRNALNRMEYTCTQADVLTPEKIDYFVNTLLHTAVSALTKALSVVPLDTFLLGPFDHSCITSGVFPTDIPAIYRNQENPTDGIDFLLLVTSRPIMGSTVLAFAYTCAQEEQTHRPMVGQVNFNTSSLIDNPGDLPRQAGAAAHEIIHSLGFSSSKFGDFIEYTGTKTGSSYDVRRLPYSEVIYAGASIVTPSVVREVRYHFNCSKLIGGELEDGGTSGATAGSHWDKKWFFNEILTGSSANFPILSNVTLALLHDSGWYSVNFDASEPLLWGANWGCDFLLEDCGKWTKNPDLPSEGFCDAPSQDVHCTFDRRGYGKCNIIPFSNYKSLVGWQSHYADPSWGGQDSLADRCGYVGQQGVTTYCNVGSSSGSVTQDSDALSFISDYGEQFLLSSRCMFSTLNKIKAPMEIQAFQDVLTPAPRSARCYNHTCVSETDLRVQVDGVWYPCPFTTNVISDVYGYGGQLECPSARSVCTGVKPDFTWPRLISISPTAGGPSAYIVITGSNFDVNQTYEVIIEASCTSVTVHNSTTITAYLPTSDHFVSLADLALFRTRLNVIVRDSRGYTDQQAKVFEIQVPFDAAYLRNLFNWMGKNPGWAVLLTLILLLPCVCVGLCLWKVLKNKKNPFQFGFFHANTNPTQYYDDDYNKETEDEELDEDYEKQM